jgi:ribonuclease III
LSHASWVCERAESYGRLAFLGDSVLGLAVAEHLFRRHPRSDIGRLTKLHGQAVSGRACVEVAEAMGLPARVREAASEGLEGGIAVDSLLASERAVASICEAVIGACYLHHGFEATARCTVAAFAEQIAIAAETLFDFKSALQERLAREGARVRYEVTDEEGPPHERVFEVAASVDGEVIGRGSGRSKKAAEQAAAEAALARLGG